MHPIIECAADISAALKAARGVEPAFMGIAEKESALVALAEARSQLDALTARVLAASDDVGEAHGLRDVAAWLAVQTRTTRREARRDLALGRALEAHPGVASALSSGALRTEQARAVVEAVDALPVRVEAETRWRAENTLLALAREHDARELKQIGKRILDLVAPEVGECHEAAVLAGEEARADAGVELVLVDDGAGRCHGRFVVPSHVGKILTRHLLALANPARHTEAELRGEAGGWKPLRRRLGEALVEYVERYPEDHTPQTAGVNATVVVTMTLEQLLADNVTALLDDGTRMSAGQARRLACEAGIIPVVLGTESQVLDLGRTRRLFTKAQRIALGLRDGGCTATGCETSASGCHAHHDDPWSRGGLTDLANGRLLCPRHHRLAHDSRYAKTTHADNKVTFARRT
ncbi:HNH endonuclease [Nocardioides flavus (ex Wang et al. 2016)]|uniref:HNH endonuclease n=1 Tax=Nocardioides flavus (ex Wang et al. 2016) TaxID=2058780 RepID=A0ABQ3HSE9_9ACTN|nr:HNH endonuclease signature motif containing protein [Nocardioides flavus (ex Wang et al. 2016)]GHE18795.1 HNH endonuclease [Nocardioides flavus (ex Wang et al. 2016)]